MACAGALVNSRSCAHAAGSIGRGAALRQTVQRGVLKRSLPAWGPGQTVEHCCQKATGRRASAAHGSSACSWTDSTERVPVRAAARVRRRGGRQPRLDHLRPSRRAKARGLPRGQCPERPSSRGASVGPALVVCILELHLSQHEGHRRGAAHRSLAHWHGPCGFPHEPLQLWLHRAHILSRFRANWTVIHKRLCPGPSGNDEPRPATVVCAQVRSPLLPPPPLLALRAGSILPSL
jgi:hypothetical protein